MDDRRPFRKIHRAPRIAEPLVTIATMCCCAHIRNGTGSLYLGSASISAFLLWPSISLLPWASPALTAPPGCALSGRALARAIAAHLREAGGDPAPESAAKLFGGNWVETCLRIARQIAKTLDYAHGEGVVHRDVKPSNAMVTLDGRTLLVDFGLTVRSDVSRMTRPGSLVGSLPYMAPEQFAEDGEQPTSGSDIYSLGVTLYELLTFQSPFESGSSEGLRSRILRDATPRRAIWSGTSTTSSHCGPSRRAAPAPMERRLARASSIGQRSIGDHREAWREAIEKIAAESGVVLVLLPGGSFWMGSQSANEEGRHCDPLATQDEGPVHEVKLAPFFLSKYELTQGQCKRTMETEPSYYGRTSRYAGAEAQWEYACRAGTDSIWSTGDEVSSLEGYCNISDEGSAAHFVPGWSFEHGFRDGLVGHASRSERFARARHSKVRTAPSLRPISSPMRARESPTTLASRITSR